MIKSILLIAVFLSGCGFSDGAQHGRVYHKEVYPFANHLNYLIRVDSFGSDGVIEAGEDYYHAIRVGDTI